MNVTEKVKSVGAPALKFVAAGGGIAVSAFALKKLDALIPASVPTLVRKLGPGVLTAIVAYLLSKQVSDDKLKALMLGLGAGGALDALRKVLPANFAQNIPALSGMAPYAAVNTGGVGWDYYLQNSLQGLKGLGNAYALSGDSFSMQGAPAYALSGDSMSMQGAGGGLQSYTAYALN